MAAAPFVAVVDEEQVRAAVTVALDASMDAMVDEIARRVLAALATRKPEPAARASCPPPRPRPRPLRPAPPRRPRPRRPLRWRRAWSPSAGSARFAFDPVLF